MDTIREITINRLESSPKISVLVVTRNRYGKLMNLLRSIKTTIFKDFEVVIVDQSEVKMPQEIFVQICSLPCVKYKKSKLRGKSKGLNLGIGMCTSQEIAFTDDDCVIDGRWLSNIHNTFRFKPKILGVFGRTLPYQKIKHRKYHCPATFDRKVQKIIDKPVLHWTECGFGNNVAYRKSVFTQLGMFKEWLGPGSIGSNAEDGEIALRVLLNKGKLIFNPKVLVYHDKWLNDREILDQELSYICGEMACYGHLYLCGHNIGKVVLRENIAESFMALKSIIKGVIKFRLPKNTTWTILSLVSRFKGVTIATVFTLKEKLVDRISYESIS